MKKQNLVRSTKPENGEDVERFHYGFVRKSYPKDGVQVVSTEFDFINWLERAEDLIAEVERSADGAYVEEPNGRGGTMRDLTKVGRKIYGLCRTFDSEIAAHYAPYRFSPPLAVALKVIGGRAGELSGYSRPDGSLHLGEPGARQVLNEILASLKQECGSADYKAVVENHRRSQAKNLASCVNYMAAQFEKRSVLLITRVDLYIRPLFKGWGYTREADACYSRLLRALTENRIIPDVLGYIAKREDGIDRGIHFHLLVIQDGHLHRDAANMARLVGEKWVQICGAGDTAQASDYGPVIRSDRGSYFNCYSRAEHYRFNGIGLIRGIDEDKLRGLRLAIEYLCKEPYQLKPDLQSGGELPSINLGRVGKGVRNLRKGVIPKGHSGRGAPRRIALDDSLIQALLVRS